LRGRGGEQNDARERGKGECSLTREGRWSKADDHTGADEAATPEHERREWKAGNEHDEPAAGREEGNHTEHVRQ
jgi:hypothetical protein